MSLGGIMKDLHNSIAIVQEIVSKRWVSEILFSINHKHYRYSEILHCIPYLSSTELRRKLKLLLEFGLLHKDDKEYHLTILGQDMMEIMIKASKLSERLENAKRRQH